jgi:hypothetical protein
VVNNGGMATSSNALDMVPGGPAAATASRAMAATALVTALLLVAGVVGAFTVHGSSSTTSVAATGDLGNLGPASQVLPAAAAATASVGSSAFALTVSIDVTQAGKQTKIDSTSTGAFDYINRAGTLDSHTTGTDTPSDVKAVFSGGDLYVSGPAVASKVPAGKEFLKVPLAAMASGVPSTTTNPAEMMSMLQGVVGTPQAVGAETVRGVETQRYAIDIDLGKAITAAQAKAKASGVSGADAAAGLFNGTVPAITVPAGVWLDGDGHIRRMQLNVDIGKVIASLFGALGQSVTTPANGGSNGSTGASALGSGTAVMTLELFDFGQKVEVQVPPADKVADAPSIAGLGDGLGGAVIGGSSGTR